MSSSRISELDCLRGIAVLSVVIYHYTHRYQELVDEKFTPWIDFRFGNFGVELFFIVSGFVIFLSVQNVGSHWEFLYKRFTRLFPTYWFCMCLTFTVTSFASLEQLQSTWFEFFVNFSMVHRLLGVDSVDGVYWSLVPELAFYFFITLFLVFNKINLVSKLTIVWLTGVYINLMVDLPKIVEWPLVLNYGMYFIAGIHFYFIFSNKAQRFNYIILLACYLAALLTMKEPLDLLVISAIFASFYAFSVGKISVINFSVLRFLGTISYSLYLLHQYIGYIIIYEMTQFGIENTFALLVVPMAITLLGATVVTFAIEKRSIRFLRAIGPNFSKTKSALANA